MVTGVFYIRLRQRDKRRLRFKDKHMSSGQLKDVKFPARATINLSDVQLVSLQKKIPSAVTRVHHFYATGLGTAGTE